MDAYCMVPQVWRAPGGQSYLARCRWQALSSGKPVSPNEAEFLAGFDPDVAARDLYDAIEEGRLPAYELQAQLLPMEEAEEWEFDLSDPTKLWPEEQIPVIRLGKMVLDESPEDHLEQVERISFSPGTLGPGIGLLKSEMAEAMVFACQDSQRHRLGDWGRFLRGRPSKGGAGEQDFVSWNYKGGVKKSKVEENFQTAERLRRMGRAERENLAGAMAGELFFLENSLQQRITKYFHQIQEDFGNSLAERLGL